MSCVEVCVSNFSKYLHYLPLSSLFTFHVYSVGRFRSFIQSSTQKCFYTLSLPVTYKHWFSKIRNVDIMCKEFTYPATQHDPLLCKEKWRRERQRDIDRQTDRQTGTDQFLTRGWGGSIGLLHRGQWPLLWGSAVISAHPGGPTGLEHLRCKSFVNIGGLI